MNNLIKLFTIVITCAVSSTAADGKANLQSILEQVEKAYGGNNLKSLQSITINSDRRLGFANTGYAPDIVEFIPDKYLMQIDLINRRGSIERYVQQNGNIFHDRTVSENGGVTQINYMLNRKSHNADGKFFGSFGSVFRISDTLLAYLLVRNPERTKFKQRTSYRDKPQTVLEFSLPDSEAKLNVYVEETSGLIQRLYRPIGNRKLVYLFRNHQVEKGITFAKENQVFLNGQLFDYEMERQISVNELNPRAFVVETELDNYQPADDSEIVAKKINSSLYHVGSGISFSTFVDMGSFILATGANDGFSDRYAAYKEAVGHQKPLKFVLLSHHHEAARTGLEDALKLDAVLLLPTSVLPMLEEKLGKERAAGAVRTIADNQKMGDAVFRIISTAHTSDMIVTYLPKYKIVLEEDHYRPVFDGPPEHLFGASVSLARKIAALNLEIDTLLSGHGAKQEKWSDLLRAIDDRQHHLCRYERAICASTTSQ